MRKIEANSTPTAPQPTTTIDLGISSEQQDFAVRENRLAVNFDSRQRTGFGTGRQQNIGGFEFGGFAVFFDADAARPGDFAPAGDGFHFVLLEQQADATGMFLDDFVFAREDRGPIDFDVFHFEAEFFGALEVIVNIRVVQKYFGGDAAYVQARAAEKRIFFNDGGLQSPLRSANRGDVSAGSAADNHDIIFSQTSPPLRLLLRQTIRFMEGCPGLRV